MTLKAAAACITKFSLLPAVFLASGIYSTAKAVSTNDIMAQYAKAVVYIEVDDDQGRMIESGTGFIVSHDGYIITAAHIKRAPDQTIWAMIGQRAGAVKMPLELREVDEPDDTAVWQLPQAVACYHSVTLSDATPDIDDHMLVLGFPETDGLSRTVVEMSNLFGPNWRANGFLREGDSGAPVFNENGLVVAFVQSGSSSGGNNTLVPISFALPLLSKRHVAVGVNSPSPYSLSCYQQCRVAANGVERWNSETSWLVKRGEYPGGHTEPQECAGAIAEAIAGKPGAQVDLAPGQGQPGISGMWEDSHKDFAGQMHYNYYCKGTLRVGPIYNLKRSDQCPLWD